MPRKSEKPIGRVRWVHTIGFGLTVLLLIFGMTAKLVGCGEKPKK